MNVNHFPESDLQKTKAYLEQQQTAKLPGFGCGTWHKSPCEILTLANGKTYTFMEELAEEH